MTNIDWPESHHIENQSKNFKIDLRIAKKTFDNLFNLHSQILFLIVWTSTETFVVPNFKSESTQIKNQTVV